MGSTCTSCAKPPAWAGVSPGRTSHPEEPTIEQTAWDVGDSRGHIVGDQGAKKPKHGDAGGSEQVLTRILVPICSRSASSAPMCAISVRLSCSSAASCSSDSCTRSCVSTHHGQYQAAPA